MKFIDNDATNVFRDQCSRSEFGTAFNPEDEKSFLAIRNLGIIFFLYISTTSLIYSRYKPSCHYCSLPLCLIFQPVIQLFTPFRLASFFVYFTLLHTTEKGIPQKRILHISRI